MRKIAVVTGAATRIGYSIANKLLQEGYLVVLHANSSFSIVKEWASKSEHKSQIIGLVSADFSINADVEKFCLKVNDVAPQIDLLVHNASAFYGQYFLHIDKQNCQQMIDVNLFAPFFITQKLVRNLLNGTNPSVINIIDAMWKRPCKNFSHYAISKGGLFVLTKALAKELAPNIRVNGVSPGIILFQDYDSEKFRKKSISQIPLGSIGKVSDIANAVLFLAEHAQYLTGETLAVDGGYSL